MIGSWLRSFPDLTNVDDSYWRQMLTRMDMAHLSRGEHLFRNGEHCCHYALMVEGLIRVSRVSDIGREIVVYRIKPGQTCLLSASTLLSGGRYPADAIAEIDSYLVLITAKDFQMAFERSSGFRRFVCEQMGPRIVEIITLLERVAFGGVDNRLAHWLLVHGEESNFAIEVSHSEIARELGTVREVVSRRLKSFERRGWVHLSRRRIQVADEQGLMQLSRDDRIAPGNGNGG